MELTEIVKKIEALEGKAADLLSKAEAASEQGNSEDVKSFKKSLDEDVMPEITRLRADREKAEREEEMKALRGQVTTLGEALEELRKPIGPFAVGGKATGSGESASDPYADGSHSFYADIKAANKGRQDAIERLTAGLGVEGKAMATTPDAQGGYLVQTQVEREIVEARELDNVLRQICSKLNVNTNEIQLDQITLGTTAGWVAELATKPESTSLALTSVSAGVFTAAGLATISNQLLADSNPAVDGLVTRDLAKRLVALEEAAFLNGSGSGQPLGLLNTPGLQATTVATTDALALLDAILTAIGQVETEHGSPSHILMHPRTWTRILRSRDADGSFYIDPNGGVQDPRTGVRGPSKTLWGVPVVTSNRVPTNLGTGANESRVIVGDYSEALILDRQGITVDESPHVYFTSNQTVFRAEERVGFTAARQPLAFSVVGGAGMAGG